MSVYNPKAINSVTTVTGLAAPVEQVTTVLPQTNLTNFNISLRYFMHAWDSVNGNFVYWITYTPATLPSSTSPNMSNVVNLRNFAILNTIL